MRKVLWQCGNAMMRHDRLQSIDVVGNAAEGVAQQVHLAMPGCLLPLACGGDQAQHRTGACTGRRDLLASGAWALRGHVSGERLLDERWP